MGREWKEIGRVDPLFGVGGHFPDVRVPTGFGLREWGEDHFPDLRVPSGFGLRDWVGDHFPDLRVPSGFGLRDPGGGPLSRP